MVVVVIDGPEKAGKSTLIEALRSTVTVNDLPTKVRKWGRLDDGRWAIDCVYAQALIEDTAYKGLILWDRSWASEAVYGKLIGRDRRLAEDPWLGEWLYGRGIPLKFILGGPHPYILTEQLDADDKVEGHGQNMAKEKAVFLEYGLRFGWHIIGNTDRERLPLETLTTIISLQVANSAAQNLNPRVYCGPPRATVVFVGEQGSKADNVPGGWLPFSSRYTTNFGRILGDTALRVGWTNAWDDRREIFQHARLVVACGSSAYDWAREVYNEDRLSGTRVEKVYHPAALYRWGRLRTNIAPTEVTIRHIVGQYIT
jgi:hypothetical protein